MVSGSFVPVPAGGVPVPAGGVPVPVGGVSVVCAGGFAVPPGLSFDSTGGSWEPLSAGSVPPEPMRLLIIIIAVSSAIRITRRTIIRLMAFLICMAVIPFRFVIPRLAGLLTFYEIPDPGGDPVRLL